MFEDMRVVVVTPAGRKHYLEILFTYILKLRPIVDEYRLWVNTDTTSDVEYMKDLQASNSDFVTLEYLPIGITGFSNSTICNFFKHCKDPNTIYIRFDDDVVFVDDIDHFKQFLTFRKNNPQYFLVYANIINNAICTHIHQRHGALGLEKGIVGYECMDPVGWRDPYVAQFIHHHILDELKGDISSFRMNMWILHHYERVSINVISWLGSEFNTFDGVVGDEEEHFLSHVKPLKIRKFNVIFGDFVCVHYAFGTQRPVIDKDTMILSGYKALSI